MTWHHGSDTRVGRYQFNTKTRDHMFCPKCGASIGIDFNHKEPKSYGISVCEFLLQVNTTRLMTNQLRQFNDVDLDSVKYRQFDGIHVLKPAIDLSGKQVNVETGEDVPSSA